MASRPQSLQSNTRIDPSRDAVATSQPCGENAMLLIGASLPRTNDMKLPLKLDRAAAQMPAFSGPAVATQRPSLLNATPLTNDVCRRSTSTSLNVVASHRARVVVSTGARELRAVR